MAFESMTTETLVKLSGLALRISRILATIGLSVHPHDAARSNHTMWPVAHVVVMSGAFLNLFHGLDGGRTRRGWRGPIAIPAC